MRRPGDIEGLKSFVASDAVIEVNDEIAGRKARHFCQKGLGPSRPPHSPHQTITKKVRFRNDGYVAGGCALLQS